MAESESPHAVLRGIQVLQNDRGALRLRAPWFPRPIAVAGCIVAALPALLCASTFAARPWVPALALFGWLLLSALLVFNGNVLAVDLREVSAWTGPIPYPNALGKTRLLAASVSEIQCRKRWLKGPSFSLTIVADDGFILGALEGMSEEKTCLAVAHLVADWLVLQLGAQRHIVVIPPVVS